MKHWTLAALALIATTAWAATPQNTADYRHNAFESMSKHMKSASMIAKGEVEVDKKDLVLHAQALNNSAQALTAWFPEGTGPDAVKTEALPAIWSDWAGFEAKAKTFEDESAKLLDVANKGDLDGFKAQFGNVGKSCGGCHDSFRKDDD